MNFTKMHGLGNDYVYISGFDQTLPEDDATLSRWAQTLSDRHFGIGSDGIILILPPTQTSAHVRMRMFNADGSEAEMCGNGIRCVAKYAIDRKLAEAKPLHVETAIGVLSIDYVCDDAGNLIEATVDMGPPTLELENIPVAVHAISNVADVQSFDLKVSDQPHRVTAVSMGNPHVVIFTEGTMPIEQPLLGQAIERHPAFPNRTNVHFVKVNASDDVTVYHWERGSGATLACGTGACAVCVAGVLNERTDRTITAHLPGGDLKLHWRQDDQHVLMTGPAIEVFNGSIEL